MKTVCCHSMIFLCLLLLAVFVFACAQTPPAPVASPTVEFPASTNHAAKDQSWHLSEADIENVVRRSYQYVAMYNVTNKFAMKQGGWQTVAVDTKLKDHTMREIARPNNDILYISALLDLRAEPIILDMPAFDSQYVSLMITGYDHYVNVPMGTGRGDFEKPEKMLIYSARTEGYDGKPVDGVDRIFEASGDFVSAVLRIMPHANNAKRFKRITEQMNTVRAITLSEFRGQLNKEAPALQVPALQAPAVGKTDAEVFENNLFEVMQYVFNHTTFDSNNTIDRELLAVYKPLGVEPGRVFDQERVVRIDGGRFAAVSRQVKQVEFDQSQDPSLSNKYAKNMFLPKGKISLPTLIFQSVIGPIGLPATEAMYFPVVTKDGAPLNGQNDYRIHMNKSDLPPAGAFWSATLYDKENGFFIPNDRKKYSVGENGGMKMNKDGSIDIYIAAGRQKGIPEENRLPITRKDEDMDMVLRIYIPDLEKMDSWKPPIAEIWTPVK